MNAGAIDVGRNEALPQQKRGWLGSRPKAATAVAYQLLAGQAAIMAASLIVNILSARTMGPTGRGSLAFLLQLSYLVSTLTLAGVERAYPATATPNRQLAAAVADMFRLVVRPATVVLSACALIGLGISLRAGNGLLYPLAFLLASAGNIGLIAFRSASAAATSGRLYLWFTLAGQTILTGLALLLTIEGLDSPTPWLAAYGVALGIPLVAGSLISQIRRRPAREETRRATAEARRLGLRILPSSLANIVMLRSDRLLLPWLSSLQQLGIYVIVATLSELIAWPIRNYVDAQLPRWHEASQAGTLSRRRVLMSAACYGATAAGILIVAGHWLIVPVFGREYGQALPLIAPLAAGAALYGISRVGIGLSLASGRASSVVLTDVPAMVVSLVVYFGTISRLGAMGAALGSLAGYGTAALLAVFFTCRRQAVDSRMDI